MRLAPLRQGVREITTAHPTRTLGKVRMRRIFTKRLIIEVLQVLKFRLEDLPEGLRRQAERQLSNDTNRATTNTQPSARKASSPLPQHPRPSKTVASPKASSSASASISSAVLMEPYENPKVRTSLKSRDLRTSLFDSKTEEEYFYKVLNGQAKIHPMTLHMKSGARYTPDFLTLDDGVITLHETKGSYRLGSQDGATRRFLEAAHEYPCFRFIWAQKEKGGAWTVKRAIEPSTAQTVL